MKNCEIKFITEEEYEEWDAFVDLSPQGNIFNKSFWIRSVSDEFQILVLKENGKIIGGIVLPSIRGRFFRNPKLTPQLGILLSHEDAKVKYSKRLSRDMEVITTIIEALPKFKQFNYGFSYNFTNLVPFIWNDFNIKLRYTYVIEDLSNIDEVFSNFQYDCKYLIKRALKNNITVKEDYSIKDFYNVNKMTFDRQKMEMPYTLEFLEELDKILGEKKCRKMFFAQNSEGELVAATYLVYDNNCTYYLMGGADPEYRKIGVQTLLVWESIKFAASIKTKFDFEGSMIKSIEKSFREFGGKQNIIYNVYKSDIFTEFLYGIAVKNKALVKKNSEGVRGFMLNFVVDKDLINKKEIAYSVFYLTENFNIEVQITFQSKDGCTNVFYGVKPDKNNSIYIPSTREFTECYNTFFKGIQGLVNFNFDILYSSFYILACKEEYDIKTRDSMDRFLSSFSRREKHINIPLFDVYSKAIFDAVKIYYEKLDFKQNKFRICLTHDVDNIDSRNRYIFLHNVKSLLTGNGNNLLYNLKVLSSQLFTNQFKQIKNYMKLEENYGAKSEFYFLQGKKHRFGSRYTLKQAYEELMVIKKNDKFVVGLHTNFFSFDDLDKIKEEKSLIENYAMVKIKSCRNHYLRFTIPDSWIKLKDAGIKFDTTLGYSDRNGFRAGTSKAFLPFSIIKQDIIDIYEIPLIIMDVSIMEKNLSLEEKWQEIKSIIDKAKEYIGTFSIVWHENVLIEKEYREMYGKILAYINDCKGEFITHQDLEQKFNNQREELRRLFSMLE